MNIMFEHAYCFVPSRIKADVGEAQVADNGTIAHVWLDISALHYFSYWVLF